MRADHSTSAALERVLARFEDMLRALGRSRGLADADLDELTQDVRVRLWRALAGRENIEAVKASYVYRTARSAALDMIRRRRDRREVPIRLEPSDPSGGGAAAVIAARDRPDSDLERRELAGLIDRAIEELREPRDVVVRLHLSGYDRFEIARLTGWTEPKVRNLIYRGLGDLREALSRQGISPGV